MNKIAILIGAGAEAKGQYDLVDGASFKKDTIMCSNIVDVIKNINKDITIDGVDIFNNIKNGQLIRSNSTNILYQTCKELASNDYYHNGLQDFYNSINQILKDTQNEFQNIGSKEIIEQYIKYRDGEEKFNEDKKQTIKQSFKSLYKTIFDSFKQYNDYPSNNQSNIEEIIKKLSIYSNLDGSFNYLRHPKLYKTECCSVIKTYYSAYMSILSKDNYDKKIKNMIKDDKNMTSGDYRRLLLNTYNDFIQNKVNSNEERTYYSIIKDKLIYDSNVEINCISLNYTTILDEILKNAKNNETRLNYNIYHLHGRMDYFEDLKSKRVCELEKFINDENSLIFPFILIQSGVKPVFSKYEIEQFYQASNAFKDADKIIVLGYSMCSDDEHITSLLRDIFIEESNTRKKLYYLVYSHSIEDFYTEIKRILKILNLNVDKITDEKYVLENKNEIIFKYLNSKNCNDIFEEVLNL